MARHLRIVLGQLACFLVVVLPGLPAHAAVLPSGFRDDVVLDHLEEPTAVSFAPGGRVFVAEKAGRVLVFDDLADDSPEVFVDMRTEVYDSGDRGILGLELDPQFPTRPYLYVLHTYDHMLGEIEPPPKWGEPDTSGDVCPKPPEETKVNECPVSGRLVRLTAGGPGGNQAVSELELVVGWCQQFASHSIGDIQFDAAGNLYASGGEGAKEGGTDYGQFGWPQKNQCGDPPTGIGGTQTVPTAEGGALRAQDAFTPSDPLDPGADPTGLSGTVIRVDPDSGEGIPGNPMFESLDANERRIVAFGFRNPFRFALDVDRDDLYVATVGWQEYEEIDHFAVDSAAAFNSGWPCYEGPVPHFIYDNLDFDLCEALYEDGSAAAAPFYAYHYDGGVYADDPCPVAGGSAVSGITVYRGGAFPPAYQGALFFADSVRGCIYAMMPSEGKDPDPSQVSVFLADGGVYPGVDIEVGPDGNLYYVRIAGGEDGKGAVHRISYDAGAPLAKLTASPTYGAADPLIVDLDASGSTDPQGEALEFDWDLRDDGAFEIDDGGPKLDDEAIAGPDTRRVAVRVEDASGSSSVARVEIHPGNTPPQPEIVAPLEDVEWSVGEEIAFVGSASDEQDPNVPSASLHWKIRLLHCPTVSSCHAHPLQVFSAIDEGSFVAPDHDYPAKLEMELSVTDSQGLTATESAVIEPSTADLTIASSPPGLRVGADSKFEPAPYSLRAIEGSNVGLSAPATQELGGDIYTWSAWSNGGPRVQSVAAAGPATYTALYTLEGEQPPGSQPGEDPPAGGGSGQLGPSADDEAAQGRAPPRTKLLGHPPKLSTSSTAAFRFSANQAGARFKCGLDRRKRTPCRSPKTYRGLRPGRHVFEVVAIGAEGVDRTPSVFRWQILGRRR
jgi:glucose/arabinose dehydrogenase